MMRMSLMMSVALSVAALAGPCAALEASDTMAAWKSASAEQKGKLVAKILKRDASASVISCLDSASSVPGHSDLPIGEVVKACESSSGQPV